MADLRNSIFRNKQFKINRNQRWAFIAIVVIVVSSVFTLYWTTTRIKLMNYRDKAIAALEENEKDLNAKISNIDSLKKSHANFKADYVLDKDDRLDDEVDNSVLVARALPTFYHKLHFETALEQFMEERNYDVVFDLPKSVDAEANFAAAEGSSKPVFSSQGGSSGSVDKAAELFEKVVPIPFTMQVKEVPFQCTGGEDDPCMEHFFRDLDRFITPIRITELSVEILNRDADDDEKVVDMILKVETYFLPEEDIVTVEEVVIEEEEQKKAKEESKEESSS